QSAQTGRFVGQTVPSTAAAAAVPELRIASSALKGLPITARALDFTAANALRGAASVAPTVGTNPAPVAEQLGTGALAGMVLPTVVERTAKAGAVAAGFGRATTPEVADLARLARDKYGLNLAADQIEGATNPVAATRYSELAKAPGSGVASRNAEQ